MGLIVSISEKNFKTLLSFFIRTVPLFNLDFTVLLRFRSQYGRLPQTSTSSEDKEKLLILRDEIMKELNLDVTLLPEEFASLVCSLLAFCVYDV